MLSLCSIPSEVSDSILNSVLWFTQKFAGNRESFVSSLNTSDSELITCGVEPYIQKFSSELNSQFIMTDVSKPDQLKYSLKIAVKRRGNLHRMFTNEGKKLAPIFDKADQAEIAEDAIEHLKASQQKLLDAQPEMRQVDRDSKHSCNTWRGGHR